MSDKTTWQRKARNVTEYSPAKTGEYPRLLKTGSLDNAIEEFSLA